MSAAVLSSFVSVCSTGSGHTQQERTCSYSQVRLAHMDMHSPYEHLSSRCQTFPSRARLALGGQDTTPGPGKCLPYRRPEMFLVAD